MNKWDLLLQAELKKRTIDLTEFVTNCCQGLDVNAQRVIESLLSTEDRQDINNRDIPPESVRAHIENWISHGMPHNSTRNANQLS